ncbi:hypothetical protein G6M89_03225 [Natronolimnobius sp. AArcel1]|uniref:hypothetical protein n=1 Tax=Natronolimnobius sp. AArcel1 TaxID=1679093 RepID=UPI0013ED6B1C|nr:hypothetical protein [Natronolimnobius sp. AArcel1]NGM68032.1 hypothetical protein [Natronolimnobius sp. AArcel1]
MTRDADYTTGDEGWLSQFEKNRFFKGKLMTPRDMEAEQAYHAERLHTVNRFIDGAGIVYGLEIQSVEDTDDGINVTISAGLALDGHGRPIVVEQVTTKSLPAPPADEFHLYAQYSEVAVETVPVPDTDGAIDDEAVPNRNVEVFELTHREEPPSGSSNIPEFDCSSLASSDDDPHTIAQHLAEQYHEHHRTSGADDVDPAVYLGAFERAPDGSWIHAAESPGRAYVYDHELLFTVFVNHITDTENPHETPIQDETPNRPDGLSGVTKRLSALEETVEEIDLERQTLQRYVLRKTLKDRIRFFETLSQRIEPHSGEGARLAREVVEHSRERLRTVDGDDPITKDAYRAQLSALLEQLIQLGEPLERVVTEASLERYLKSVSRLQSSIESNEPLIKLVDAHDRVCEAADSLEILVDVVPEA